MPLSALSITVPSLEDAARDLEIEGSLVAGERVALTLRLPESAGIGVAEANGGALRVRVLSQAGEHDLAALVGDEPWTQSAQGGALLATLDLATVQAVGAFGPLPSPSPSRRMWPFPPPPPKPDAISVRIVVEYARGTGEATMLGVRAMRLLRWPGRGRENTDLLDLATGRVYSAEEVDSLVQGAKNYADGISASLVRRLDAKANLVDGKVPSDELPSYVDDVEEYASLDAFPEEGEEGKIYVAKDVNKTYRWTGTQYTKVGGDDAILTPVYSDTPTFSEWTLTPDDTYTFRIVWDIGEDIWVVTGQPEAGDPVAYIHGTKADTVLRFTYNGIPFTATRTRTDILGYKLGDQSDKPLAPAKNYALKSDIPAVPVKAVKRNGTALTPDASGAVNVEVPEVDASLSRTGAAADAKKTGDRLTRLDNTATTLRSLVISRLSRAEAVSGFTEWVQLAPDTNLYVASEFNYDFTARTLSFDLADVTTGDVYPCVFSDVAEDATTVSGQPQGFAGMVTLARTRLRPTAAQEAAWNAKQDAIFDIATIRSGASAGATAYQKPASGIPASDLAPGAVPTVPTNVSAFANDAGYLTEHQSLANYVQKSQTAGLLKNDGTVDTNTYLTQHQDISGKLDAAARNLLPYAISVDDVILAPQIAVYRAALNADGSFPTIVDSGIPTAASYYCFELEMSVPSTVPATIYGPTMGGTAFDSTASYAVGNYVVYDNVEYACVAAHSGPWDASHFKQAWVFLDGHGLPDPADLLGGETICVSVRLDCTKRTFLASVWRVA